MAEPNKSSTSVPDQPPEHAATNRSQNFMKWALVFLPLGYLWFHLIDNLRIEWDTNPQYSYGLVVPFLVAGLLLRRWQHSATRQRDRAVGHSWLLLAVCGVLAFLFFPTRLVEAATPEWRPLQWLLAIEVIGLTLTAIYLIGGKNWLRLAAFPFAFFLVALPWPSPIETPIIQGLSRMNAEMVVEVLGVLGVPAMAHGNVLEVSTGTVGINDACSGIRSFQSSLMISLFLGEFFMFPWRRRLLLLPIGFALAMVLNLCRASLLTWLAAKKGIEAIGQYHDEAGLTILLVCTALMWIAAWLLSLRKFPIGPKNPAETGASLSLVDDKSQNRLVNRFAVALIVWLVVAESGVQLWYHLREANFKPGPSWTVVLPEKNPTYQALPMTAEEHALLRFDEGKQGRWREEDGTAWQLFYCDWRPGRVAGYLAKRHTPDICLTATGLKMTSGPTLTVVKINQIELPLRHYVFESSSGPLQVYQCHWEAGMRQETYTAEESARFNLIRGIWAGRGNQGQKVLEVIITGCSDQELAKQALVQQLEKLIKVES